MSVSKKLSIIQLSITGLTFILGIIFISKLIGIVSEADQNTQANSSEFNISKMIWISILFILSGLAYIVTGIVQIVFGTKESNDIAMIAGIIALLIILPFINIFTSIGSLVLNIIVVSKKDEEKIG